jgi:hypothetical protein
MKEKLFYITFMDNKANIGISHIIKERNSYEKERTKYRFVGQSRGFHITGMLLKKFIDFYKLV